MARRGIRVHGQMVLRKHYRQQGLRWSCPRPERSSPSPSPGIAGRRDLPQSTDSPQIGRPPRVRASGPSRTRIRGRSRMKGLAAAPSRMNKTARSRAIPVSWRTVSSASDARSPRSFVRARRSPIRAWGRHVRGPTVYARARLIRTRQCARGRCAHAVAARKRQDLHEVHRTRSDISQRVLEQGFHPRSFPADPAAQCRCALLFDSTRELLINTAKHAGGDRATVTIHHGENGNVRISVCDEGRGSSAAW